MKKVIRLSSKDLFKMYMDKRHIEHRKDVETTQFGERMGYTIFESKCIVVCDSNIYHTRANSPYKHTTHLTCAPTYVDIAIFITMHQHLTHTCLFKRAKPSLSCLGTLPPLAPDGDVQKCCLCWIVTFIYDICGPFKHFPH